MSTTTSERALPLLLFFFLPGFAGVSPPAMEAQPLTERTTNLEGAWVTSPWNLNFNFAHRFQVVGGGEDSSIGDLFRDGKIVNYPTFDLALGLPGSLMAGVDYSSNSLVGPGPNEWQPYLKYRPVSDLGPAHLSLGVTGAWNGNVQSADGEIAVDVRPGPLVVSSTLRGFSEASRDGDAALAVGGGLALRVNRYVTLAGDAVELVAGADGDVAWSGSVNVGIPFTPHTLSVQATNISSGTLQGGAAGVDAVYWGFEFTVPFSGFARWGKIVKPGEAEEAAAPGPPPSTAPGARAGRPGSVEGAEVVEVEIGEFEFGPGEMRIPVGTTVRWVNKDPVGHTTAGREGEWRSPLLGPSESYEFTFTTPGRYDYFCTLHPYMEGVLVVTERRP